ncbi:hypothetical protein GF327_06795 [Candidatus Woesearchaeota archaeon]|nr:hypothetical protein [Candidatus Woesearchaeota archaeon]
MIYSTDITNSKFPDSRLCKYFSHYTVGVKDIAGAGLIKEVKIPDFKTLPFWIQNSESYSNILMISDYELIDSTGEIHWNQRFTKEPETLSDLVNSGRIEFHGFEDIKHFFLAEVSGPNAQLRFKKKKTTELNEAFEFRKDKKTARTLSNMMYGRIRDNVLDLFFRDIKLAEYPGKYFVINNSRLEIPESFASLGLNHSTDTSVFEGKYSLFNQFPYSN